MGSTRNVLILAGNLILGAIAVVFFCIGRLNAEQLTIALACLGFPSVASIFGSGGKGPPDAGASGDASSQGASAKGPSGSGLARFALAIFCLGIALTLAEACRGPQTPAELAAEQAAAEKVADGACETVSALSSSGVVKAICANAGELADMGVLIATMRQATTPDGMPTARQGKCQPIPSTAVCATNDERLEAIESALAKRGASK